MFSLTQLIWCVWMYKIWIEISIFTKYEIEIFTVFFLVFKELKYLLQKRRLKSWFLKKRLNSKSFLKDTFFFIILIFIIIITTTFNLYKKKIFSLKFQNRYKFAFFRKKKSKKEYKIYSMQVSLQKIGVSLMLLMLYLVNGELVIY